MGIQRMTITTLKKATQGAVNDLNVLIQQLREKRFQHKGTLRELRDIVGDKKVSMIVAKENGHIIGVATLYVVQKMGKRTGYVEDVVVHIDYRGRGIGKKIMRALIKTARSKKVASLSLTSRPAREVAHMMYKKLGFERKETNVYRMYL